jgi:hypothetical protein
MRRYHKRSNVESTFSAVKRKFGDSVMSRSDAGMVNEVPAGRDFPQLGGRGNGTAGGQEKKHLPVLV